MGGFLSLLLAYVLGGLTLLPMLGLAFYVYTSVPFGDPDPSKLVKSAISCSTPASDPTELQEDASSKQSASKVPPPRYGWLTVRKTFKPRVQDKDGGGSQSSSTSQSSTSSTYSSLLRSVRPGKESPSLSKEGSPTPQPTHAYVPPPEFFYAALKGSILYLYTSESLEECHAVLDLQQHDVTFYPIEGLMDGEIYAKRNSIHLKPKKRATASSLEKTIGLTAEEAQAAGGGGQGDEKRSKSSTGLLHPSAWFVFVQSNIEMEDWYIALKHASSEDPHAAMLDQLAPVFSEEDMKALIDMLDAEPDQIPMRWFNAIFGRIFLGINRTAWLEDFIKSKLHKKLHRLALPSFLSPLMVTQVSLSSPPPTFSRPMLKDLSPQGEASMEVFVSYPGELRVSVTTTATLSLGGRFKSYQVPLVLTLIIKEIEGDLRVRVKGPPSNRLWYGFSGEPKMTIIVEPVVSATQIKWSLILKPIEKQLREVFHESVVLPNMDDIPWFNSEGLTRGGIFSDAARTDVAPASTLPTPETMEEPISEPPETFITSPIPSLFTGSLRKRQSTTSSFETSDSDAHPPGHGVSRVETAPPDLDHSSSASTSSSQQKKTWFGVKSNLSDSLKGSASTKPKDAPVASSSVSMVSVDSASSETTGRGRSNSTRSLAIDTESAPSLSSSTTEPLIVRSSTPPKSSSGETPGSGDDGPVSPASSNLTAASVVSAWRNRNTDKEAFNKLGVDARNAAKKWGSQWASKRKGGASATEEHPAEGETVVDPQGHTRGGSAGSSKDLFGRLTAQLSAPAQDPPRSSDTSSAPGTPSTATGQPRLPSFGRTPSPARGSSPGRSTPLKSVDGLRAVTASTGPTTAVNAELVAGEAIPSSPPMISHASSSASVPTVLPSTTDDRPVISRAPVKTQMSASKMMSIPSIPASRRTDEQSFGSQPEPKPEGGDSDSRSVESSSFEGRNRLGSVYRLFGSVSSSPEDKPLSSKPANGPVPVGVQVVQATPPEERPSELPSSGAATPPPLPARSPNLLSTRNRSSSTSSVSLVAEDLPSSRDEPASTTSPSTSFGAQEQLMKIAQLDRVRTASLPGHGPSVDTPLADDGHMHDSNPSTAQSSPKPRPPPLPPRTPTPSISARDPPPPPPADSAQGPGLLQTRSRSDSETLSEVELFRLEH